MARGEPQEAVTSPDAKPTYQAESDRTAINHLEIAGGMGISQQLYGMPIG
jgi:hypothetical protein